jgi:hypothetical protein
LATFAGKPPGSGANFAKLKTKLAARGARNPGALAAFIGRRKYGHKGFAKLARGSSHANTTPAMEFAMTTMPVRNPSDLVIVRGESGNAIIRHRSGGDEIGQIRRDGRGWRASIGGRDLDLRTHQRTALADVIGTHNRGALTPQHRPASSAGEVLQPPPQQTDLMRTYGIPAIRALATPTTSVSDGPRMTGNGSDSDNDDDSGPSGLNAKGTQIYKKLKSRGFTEARALAFARRAQNFGSKS